MPNEKVKVGTEIKVFVSSGAQSLVSIDTAGIATETGSVSAMGWQEVGFYRHPLDQSEPINIIDIIKGRLIDHTKKGLEQRKTLTMVAAFTNTANALRKFRDLENLVKIEWHIDAEGPTDEYEYYTSARMTDYVRGVPQEEVQERVTFVYSKYGHRPGP